MDQQTAESSSRSALASKQSGQISSVSEPKLGRVPSLGPARFLFRTFSVGIDRPASQITKRMSALSSEAAILPPGKRFAKALFEADEVLIAKCLDSERIVGL